MKIIMIKVWKMIVKAWNYKPREIVTHHDNKPGSYYYEAQRALREKRKDYEDGKL